MKKIKYILYTIMLAIIPVNAFAETYSYRGKEMNIVYIVGVALLAIRIVVPILLIVTASIDLVKAMIQNDDREMKKNIKSILPKVIAAIIIFLLPSLISLILNIVNYDDFNEYKTCLLTPTSCKVELWTDTNDNNNDSGNSNNDNNNNDNGNGNGNDNDNDNGYTEPIYSAKNKLEKNGVYIALSTEESVTGYYFSSTRVSLNGDESNWIKSTKNNIDFVLLPGSYYIYTKVANGEILENYVQISESDIVDTRNVGDIKELHEALKDFLPKNGTSVDELDKTLYRSAQIAGMVYGGIEGDRKRVSVIGLAFSQVLYKRWKVKLPYNQGDSRLYSINPDWGKYLGSKSKNPSYKYKGIACGNFIAWDFSAAGYKMTTGMGSSYYFQGSYGTFKAVKGDNKTFYAQNLKVGDIVSRAASYDSRSHVALVIYIASDGMWVVESDSIGIVTNKYDYNKRWRSMIDMSKTYNNRKDSTYNGF